MGAAVAAGIVDCVARYMTQFPRSVGLVSWLTAVTAQSTSFRTAVVQSRALVSLLLQTHVALNDEWFGGKQWSRVAAPVSAYERGTLPPTADLMAVARDFPHLTFPWFSRFPPDLLRQSTWGSMHTMSLRSLDDSVVDPPALPVTPPPAKASTRTGSTTPSVRVAGSYGVRNTGSIAGSPLSARKLSARPLDPHAAAKHIAFQDSTTTTTSVASAVPVFSFTRTPSAEIAAAEEAFGQLPRSPKGLVSPKTQHQPSVHVTGARAGAIPALTLSFVGTNQSFAGTALASATASTRFSRRLSRRAPGMASQSLNSTTHAALMAVTNSLMPPLFVSTTSGSAALSASRSLNSSLRLSGGGHTPSLQLPFQLQSASMSGRALASGKTALPSSQRALGGSHRRSATMGVSASASLPTGTFKHEHASARMVNTSRVATTTVRVCRYT